jgi:hypothetical protein
MDSLFGKNKFLKIILNNRNFGNLHTYSKNLCFCLIGLHAFENVHIALFVFNYFEILTSYKEKNISGLQCIRHSLSFLFEMFFVPLNI